MRNDERRLRVIFQRALRVALAVPAIAACADAGTTTTSSPADDAGADATTSTADGGVPHEGGLDGGGGGCAYRVVPSEPVDTCGTYVRLPCGLPEAIVPRDNCYFEINDCASLCPGTYFNCHAVGDACLDSGVVAADDAGGVTVDCSTCLVGVGRIPEGLAPLDAVDRASPVGAYFARASHFEAASVHAFRRLRRDLARHGAPRRLLRAARRAERDETQHARLTARAARRFGASPRAPRVAAIPPRTLDAVALENAVEGCVRETFGALVLHHQAATARDRDIAAMLASIARDETRHAALSWSVAAWAASRVDAAARARIAAACADALVDLRRALTASRPPDAKLARVAGLPCGPVAEALLRALEADLFATIPFCSPRSRA